MPWLICLLGLVLGSTPSRVTDEAEFLAGLKDVRTQMEQGGWEEAEEALLTLLRTHRSRDYVLARRDELIADYTRMAFHLEVRLPRPAELISGDLLSFRQLNGRVKLRYRSDGLDDFERQPERPPGGGWIYLHPMPMRGPYVLEIEGEAYPESQRSTPLVFLDVTENELWAVSLGVGPGEKGVIFVKPTVQRIWPGGSEIVGALDENPIEPESEYHLKFQVDAKRIRILYNRRELIDVTRSVDTFGRFGYSSFPFEKLTLNGLGEPSWLQGLVDAATRERRAEFARDLDLSRGLPDWLLAAPATQRPDLDSKHYAWGRLTPNESALFDGVTQALEADRLEAAVALLSGRPAQAIDPGLSAFLWTQIELLRGRNAAALRHARLAARSRPEFFPARLAQCDLMIGLREPGATEMAERLIGDFPAEPRAHEARALAHLLVGDWGRAEQAIERAKTMRLQTDSLARIERSVRRARRGPEWSRTFTEETAHYSVHTDIDPAVCREAARLLEEAFELFNQQLVRLPVPDPAARFSVFLFSGQAGYQAYLQEVLGARHPHTAGLYNPALRQLLIWNVPDRAQMLRTVRHEALHQYLDRLNSRVPNWLNEGIAEYFERLGGATRRPELGAVSAEHLRALRVALDEPGRLRLSPLRDFIDISDADFYGSSFARSYAQSWAIVHFLRHESDQSRARFARILESIAKGDGAEDIRSAFLEGGTASDLEKRLLTYLDRLDRAVARDR